MACLIWAIYSVPLWKERKDRDALWFIWLGAIGFVAEVINFTLRYVVHAPPEILLLSSLGVFIFGIVALLIVFRIAFKMLMRRRKK